MLGTITLTVEPVPPMTTVVSHLVAVFISLNRPLVLVVGTGLSCLTAVHLLLHTLTFEAVVSPK